MEGRLGISMATQLLAVKVEAERPVETIKGKATTFSSGNTKIKPPKGTVCIAVVVDVTVLRTALECLVR